jgi:hypothetical protein
VGSGGNWNATQTLGSNGQVTYPNGPLIGFTAADTVSWVDAWVVQRSTGASQASNHGALPTGAQYWKADRVLWKDGTFQTRVGFRDCARVMDGRNWSALLLVDRRNPTDLAASLHWRENHLA